MAAQQTLIKDAYAYDYARSENSFSIVAELKQICSAGIARLFFYPVHILSQRLATRSDFFKQCSSLPHFTSLWKTIRGGSFAYNSLLLGITPLHFAASRTVIADLTCLAILFGDEFIDGISQTTGKPFVASLMKDNKEHFYLQTKSENGKTVLFYQFDVRKLISAEVLNTVNAKYAITYSRFYELLLLLLEDLNQHLTKLSESDAIEAAGKIVTVCNACFDTYIHDIETAPVQQSSGSASQLLYFHTQKNQPIQYQLLELRCMLAKRLHVMQQPSITGWLNIISVMQYYDDMMDAAADDEYQDNIFLNIASQKFEDEYEWFRNHKELLTAAENTAAVLSVHMPCSVHECMKMIAKMVSEMDWQQRKICNYLLRKNWFVKDSASNEISQAGINSLYEQVAQKMSGRVGATEIKAYVTDLCFHAVSMRQQLFDRSRLAERYEMRLDMLSMSPGKKCQIFDKVFAGSL
ncbi:MAG: hypothetical protein V4722_21645 [Bacteroidota bacterium]